jgi:hypothetical protein
MGKKQVPVGETCQFCEAAPATEYFRYNYLGTCLHARRPDEPVEEDGPCQDLPPQWRNFKFAICAGCHARYRVAEVQPRRLMPDAPEELHRIVFETIGKMLDRPHCDICVQGGVARTLMWRVTQVDGGVRVKHQVKVRVCEKCGRLPDDKLGNKVIQRIEVGDLVPVPVPAAL